MTQAAAARCRAAAVVAAAARRIWPASPNWLPNLPMKRIQWHNGVGGDNRPVRAPTVAARVTELFRRPARLQQPQGTMRSLRGPRLACPGPLTVK